MVPNGLLRALASKKVVIEGENDDDDDDDDAPANQQPPQNQQTLGQFKSQGKGTAIWGKPMGQVGTAGCVMVIVDTASQSFEPVVIENDKFLFSHAYTIVKF